MKKIVTLHPAELRRLAVVGGALIAPTLATERQPDPPSAAPARHHPLRHCGLRRRQARRPGRGRRQDPGSGDRGADRRPVQLVWAKRDYDDGRLEYEVEFLSGDWKYEVEVDAASAPYAATTRTGRAGATPSPAPTSAPRRPRPPL